VAKSLSEPEAFALARIAAADGSGRPEIEDLVKSRLAGDPQASSAFETAQENPNNAAALYDVAAHLRRRAKDKEFRATVRSKIGHRKDVAAIGVAQRVALILSGQDTQKDLAHLVQSRLRRDPEAARDLESLQENPDDDAAVSSLAEHLRKHTRDRTFREALRSTWGPNSPTGTPHRPPGPPQMEPAPTAESPPGHETTIPPRIKDKPKKQEGGQ
jgi:hypothetical protein